MIFASIIIPTCNRTDDLRACLEKLVPQLPADGSVEVIAADDGSSSLSKEMLTVVFPSVQWLQGPRRGPAANRNRGALAARGEWLIFMDDDLVPEPGYLQGYLDVMQAAPRQLCVLEGATMRLPKPPSLLWEAPENIRAHGHLTCSCNFAIRAATYRDMEGFDERYLGGVYAEDTDLSARLQSAGFRVEFVPAACVVHPIRHLPDVAKLARRWEGKVIFAFDQGASWLTVGWRLPWHVLRVIQSRFRNQPMSNENLHAVVLFFGEWLLVLCQTPAWVWKWMSAPRSRFWRSSSHPVPKFGF
ncbi:MAG: glycosyltransferase family 2 protein [Prosthecobacter sp.]